jgi:hypothetical protein
MIIVILYIQVQSVLQCTYGVHYKMKKKDVVWREVWKPERERGKNSGRQRMIHELQ